MIAAQGTLLGTLRKYRFEILCLAPFLVYLGAFTFVPVLQVFRISLTAFDGRGLTLAHYGRLFSQSDFRAAFLHTVVIALGSLLIEMVLGLALAVSLTAIGRRSGWLKTLLTLPLAVPTVVAAVMMTYLFSTSGWVNRILMDLGLISQNLVWLSGDARSLFAVMVADCWKVTPLVMLILLAGLQGIDGDLYEAAGMDGARSGQMFRYITLPLLMPSITTAVIIRGIDAFRIFSLALILTGENLKVIGTYAYLEYVEYHNEALSAASAVILFLLILFAIVVYTRLVGREGLQAT